MIHLAYHVEDLAGNIGDPVTAWPSAVPGGPQLSLGGGTAILTEYAGRRAVQLSDNGYFVSPAPVTLPAVDVLASIVSVDAPRHALHHRRVFNPPYDSLLVGPQNQPSAEYAVAMGQYLGMRLSNFNRWAYQASRIFTWRRSWPYTAAGRHALGISGVFPPPQFYGETAATPMEIARPYFLTGHSVSDGHVSYARRSLIEDATTSRHDRHRHLRLLAALEALPYRGASCIVWTLQSAGWGAPVTDNKLTIVPNARWFAGARAIAGIQAIWGLPPDEPITGPPGWTQVARLHQGSTIGLQWGRCEWWTKVITGAEVGVPQTWSWTTPVLGASIMVLVVSDEALQTPTLRVASFFPIGTDASGVTTVEVSLQASRRWALAVPFVSYDGTYTMVLPTVTTSPPWWQHGVGAPFLALTGAGDVATVAVTWTMAAEVRGYAGMLELYYPDDPPFGGGGGLKATRMGILTAPRPRKRPGPG